MIDDCINRPLITAEVIVQALRNRMAELLEGSIHWHQSHDDNRAEEAEILGNSAFWIIINELKQWTTLIDADLDEMLDEQSSVYQDRVREQAIEM